MPGDVWPRFRVLLVEFNPHSCSGVDIWHDCFDRAFGLAYAAIDAVALSNDKHGLAFVKAAHRADGNAVHILASDAAISDDERHAATLKMLVKVLKYQGAATDRRGVYRAGRG